MTHARAIADRLPPLYAAGELLHDVVHSGPGLAMEVVDEDLVEVRRAHAFDTALELAEAAGLAALLDVLPEPWQDLAQFRAWVHALRAAVLEHGAVAVRALQVFVETYAARYVAASGAERLALALPRGPEDWLTDPWADGVSEVERASRPAFLENPFAHRTQRAPRAGGVEPLDRMTVVNGGLDPVPAGLLLVGVPGGPEHVPVVVNVTTGQAVVFLGSLRPGERLRVECAGDAVTAEVEGADVTHLLRSVRGVVPGVPWDAADVDATPRPLTLDRGANVLWYLPVAHYDSPGLDRVLLALASLDLRQGRWDEARLDKALFHQEPAAILSVAWTETLPATVVVTLPGGALLARRGTTDEALADRGELERALDLGVDRLSAAGVRTSVRMAPFAETQAQEDRLNGWLPRTVRERGPTGADTLPDAGGLFEVTTYEGSTYR
ncbi:MAG TPA: hypothetical protein VF519_00125 [Mycobacteriales bacterium]|jgi:hypothetical protein